MKSKKAVLPGQAMPASQAREKQRSSSEKYRQENPEKFREIVKKSKEKNKEAVRIRNKLYREANKEKILEKRKEYYWKNREKELARTAGYADQARQSRVLTGGSRLPPKKYRAGSGFVMIETQDSVVLPTGRMNCVLPRGV